MKTLKYKHRPGTFRDQLFTVHSINDVKWIKLFSAFKLSVNTIGNYLLPLVKQLFRDNFMGSEMDDGDFYYSLSKVIFLLAVFTITHNPLSQPMKN